MNKTNTKPQLSSEDLTKINKKNNSSSSLNLQSQQPTRHDSIVEMLSTPPPPTSSTTPPTGSTVVDTGGVVVATTSTGSNTVVNRKPSMNSLNSNVSMSTNTNSPLYREQHVQGDSGLGDEEQVRMFDKLKISTRAMKHTFSSSSASSLSSLDDVESIASNVSNVSNVSTVSDGGNSSSTVDLTKTVSQQQQHTQDKLVSKVHRKSWQYIKLSSLIETNKLVFINGKENSVEMAFNKLIEYNLTSLPVESFDGDMDCLTFDYNDLNSYLLLVLNKIKVNDLEIMKDCQSGKPVFVGEMIKLTPKNPFYKIPEHENLSAAMSILGSGMHRIAITDSKNTKIKGILSQRRLIKYLWDNARSFDNFENLLNMSLKDLKIGVINGATSTSSSCNTTTTTTNMNKFKQSRVIAINGDEPLINALYKMHEQSISSIAVVDNSMMLLGNISVTDVKHVTRTSQFPLLHNTCRHFISIILNNRGLEMGGKDSFPIFHVYPTSSLARTMAKLVATKAHRLWIVEPKNSSGVGNYHSASTSSSNSSSSTNSNNATDDTTENKPSYPHHHNHNQHHRSSFSSDSHSPAGDSGQQPQSQDGLGLGAGKLIGVVSLSDILGLFVRNEMNSLVDPQTARRQRSIAGK